MTAQAGLRDPAAAAAVEAIPCPLDQEADPALMAVQTTQCLLDEVDPTVPAAEVVDQELDPTSSAVLDQEVDPKPAALLDQ